MAGNYWVKVYQDILDDPKIGRLRVALKWRFIECLLVAGEHADEGMLPPVEDMAWRLRSDAEKLDTDLRELANAGLLDMVEGCWRVTKFKQRQEPSKAALRMRRYRQRKKEESDSKEEEETDTEPEPYRARNALRNGNVTLDVPSVLATKQFDTAWKKWCAHIVEKGLSLTKEQANLELARLGEMGHDAAIEAIHYSIRKGWKGIYPPSDNGYNGGGARGVAAAHLVLDHIKTYGTRKKLKADEATLAAVSKAGGLTQLGRMSDRDVISAISGSYEEVPA